MPVTTLLLTAEEFGRLPNYKHAELINTEVKYRLLPIQFTESLLLRLQSS